jgi:hypothetical protein
VASQSLTIRPDRCSSASSSVNCRIQEVRNRPVDKFGAIIHFQKRRRWYTIVPAGRIQNSSFLSLSDFFERPCASNPGYSSNVPCFANFPSSINRTSNRLKKKPPTSSLLNRRRNLPLPRRRARSPARPLRFLRHARFSVQLLVGSDHVCFFCGNFLAVDYAETGSCWDVESSCCGGGAAGDAGCCEGGSVGGRDIRGGFEIWWWEEGLRGGHGCGCRRCGWSSFLYGWFGV